MTGREPGNDTIARYLTIVRSFTQGNHLPTVSRCVGTDGNNIIGISCFLKKEKPENERKSRNIIKMTPDETRTHNPGSTAVLGDWFGRG